MQRHVLWSTVGRTENIKEIKQENSGVGFEEMIEINKGKSTQVCVQCTHSRKSGKDRVLAAVPDVTGEKDRGGMRNETIGKGDWICTFRKIMWAAFSTACVSLGNNRGSEIQTAYPIL